ncbi:hypothetical protein BH11PSE14_BH11PSE14_08990 [soil metagenome]
MNPIRKPAATRLAHAFACIGIFASGAAQAGFLDDLACPLFGCADGPAPDLQLSCRTSGLVGQPEFSGHLPGSASYRIRGNCSSADHAQSVSYDVDATWTPSETDPDRPNATEIFDITSNDNLSPDTRGQGGGEGYTEHVILSAHCDRDPWLFPASCRRIGDTLPDSVHQTWSVVPTGRFPTTASAIGAVERSRLRADYNAANGIEDDSFRARATNVRPPFPGAGAYDESSATARVRHRAVLDAVDSSDDPSIRVRIRYPVALGYRDARGVFDPNPTSCDAFHISALPDNLDRDNRQPVLIKVAARPGMRTQGDNYVCDYVISFLPLDTNIHVQASIGSGRQRSTEAWQGGEQAQPTLGQFRSVIDDTRVLSLSADQPRASLDFRMEYAGGIPSGRFDERASQSRSAAVRAALTPAPDPRICEYARSARARNSPAAPSLEKQCREAGGTPY